MTVAARSRQEACLGLQPFTDDPGTLLSVVRPGFREKESPGLGKPGLNGRKAGIGGVGISFSPNSCLWWLRRWRLLIQSSRVATLLQLRHRVIRDGVSLIFVQPFLQTAYDLGGAPQRESNRVLEHFSLRHSREEHIENNNSSRYILRAFCEGVTTARRQEGSECVGVSPSRRPGPNSSPSSAITARLAEFAAMDARFCAATTSGLATTFAPLIPSAL